MDIVLSLKEIKVGEVTKLAESPIANGGSRNQIQLHPSPQTKLFHIDCRKVAFLFLKKRIRYGWWRGESLRIYSEPVSNRYLHILFRTFYSLQASCSLC